MAISCLFLTDAKGKVIIGRNYRGDIPTSTSERFAQYIQDKDEMDQRPIFTEGGCTFAYIKHNNLFLTCVTRKNSNVALALMTLYRLISDYFGGLDEESIRDNFVVIYELMDETLDFGYPQSLDAKILREFITQKK